MSYSHKNPAWDRLHKSQMDARIQRELHRAKELLAANPRLTRDEALRKASQEEGK